MIAQLFHIFLAARRASRVRRAHISREEAKDVAERHFVLPHFIFPLVRFKIIEICVRPGVRTDLMTFSVHASGRIRRWYFLVLC